MSPIRPPSPGVRSALKLLLFGGFGAGAGFIVPSTVSSATAQESHLLVVVGLGGDEEHRDRFHGWAGRLVDAAVGPLGLGSERVHYLGERPDRDPERIDGRSTRDGVSERLQMIAGQSPNDAHVVLILIGHGSERDGQARVNLPGPDLTAGELGQMLEGLGDRPTTVIQTTSASGGFLEALSREGRVIMTATRSAREGNEPRFPEHLTAAFTDGGADTDKDGRVSMLEAFTYARLEVVRSHEQDGILLTEHALLDDNGDGVGSPAPPEDGEDGAVARRRFLAPGSGRPGVVADPELAGLYARRDSLQAEVDALRDERGTMTAEAYESRLEALLVDLALLTREIRAREGGGE
jgi:hypothetical protein